MGGESFIDCCRCSKKDKGTVENTEGDGGDRSGESDESAPGFPIADDGENPLHRRLIPGSRDKRLRNNRGSDARIPSIRRQQQQGGGAGVAAICRAAKI